MFDRLRLPIFTEPSATEDRNRRGEGRNCRENKIPKPMAVKRKARDFFFFQGTKCGSLSLLPRWENRLQEYLEIKG